MKKTFGIEVVTTVVYSLSLVEHDMGAETRSLTSFLLRKELEEVDDRAALAEVVRIGIIAQLPGFHNTDIERRFDEIQGIRDGGKSETARLAYMAQLHELELQWGERITLQPIPHHQVASAISNLEASRRLQPA
jgi:hypothetical protein